MKLQILLIIIKMLVKILTPELMTKLREKIVEKIEAYIAGTETKIDDFIYNALKGGEELKIIADAILDFCEDYVLGTASVIDDALVLPICTLIRATFNIPDDDD